jgi:hypothetical protein
MKRVLDRIQVLILSLATIWPVVLIGCGQPVHKARKAEIEPASAASLRWWKGNLHTHSKWSDGNHYPEMVADWYKQQGYHFLALTDHNILQTGTRWVPVDRTLGRAKALAEYQQRFGEKWVELRQEHGERMVRLKTLEEIRPLVEEADRFCLISGEEISDAFGRDPIHLNGINITEMVRPQRGKSVSEVIARNVCAVQAQQAKSGQSMFTQLNHPDFGKTMTADDVINVPALRFFEVCNGGTIHATTEQAWDTVLTQRLTVLHGQLLYGVANDDAHTIDSADPNAGDWGTAWVMVRASHLSPESIVKAMEAGDFYATTGVGLRDIRFNGRQVLLEIDPEDGVTYTTEFIGTRKGFVQSSGRTATSVKEPQAMPIRDHERHGIGALLAEVVGTSPSYTFAGDEIYVRAKVTSSEKKGSSVGVVRKVAWTQPLVPAPK